MKTLILVAAITMLVTTVNAQTTEATYFTSASQYAHADQTTVEHRYLACLRTDNDGVIESALAHVAMMKLALPFTAYRTVQTRVAELSRTALSAEIRYKAFLTQMVLDDPGLFRGMTHTVYNSPDELFGALASRLSEHYATQ